MSKNHYPEHLNPFAEPKNKATLKISNSFREFTKTLRKSFRIKRKTKKDDVEIRQKLPDFQRLCPKNRETYPTLAFPRSRFEERLTRTPNSTLPFKFEPIPSPNPFEEEVRTIRRKHKKRAPLPPSKAISSQNITENLNIPLHNQSKWSLNSIDTEYSYSTDNVGSECDILIDYDTLAEKIANFTKEMEKLNDDSNNNNISSECQGEENNVPDLVVSCSNDEVKDIVNDKKETSNEEVKLSKLEEKSESLETEVKTEETNNEPFKTNEDIPAIDEDVIYIEKKDIFISGSRDELNNEVDTGRYSLFIASSAEAIDRTNNNIEDIEKLSEEDGNISENGREEEITPIPKQRKNKLTKNTLLGTTNYS